MTRKQWFVGAVMVAALYATGAVEAGAQTRAAVEPGLQTRAVIEQGVEARSVDQWWWVHGLTAEQLQTQVEERGARIDFLEAYELHGRTRFAAVLVAEPTVVAEARPASSWVYGVTTRELLDRVDDEELRVVRLEAHGAPGKQSQAVPLFAAELEPVLEDEDLWWYVGLTRAQIDEKIAEHDARILDLAIYEDGGRARFGVVLAPRDDASPESWWYLGLSARELSAKAREHGARIIDAEAYGLNNSRWAAVLVAEDAP